MRAFALDAFGQPGSIHDVPEPEPAEGQVRVRVAAASLNPFDNAVLAGYMKDRMEHRFPLIPAGDFSGTVDAVGSGVTGYAVGDHIFGVTGKMVFGAGTLAEKTTATAGTIARRPQSITDVEAAALPLAGVSALMCVDAVGPKPKDVVVVVGAGGGIGSYAVQLAKGRGAHVIGVTTKENADYVKGLGADEVIDRTAGDVLEALKSKHKDGVAAIIDTGSDATGLAHLSGAVHKGGTVVSMKGFGPRRAGEERRQGSQHPDPGEHRTAGNVGEAVGCWNVESSEDPHLLARPRGRSVQAPRPGRRETRNYPLASAIRL
jgi:NADPH:quinone reductase-like Zn-dependent oxidoreductase